MITLISVIKNICKFFLLFNLFYINNIAYRINAI